MGSSRVYVGGRVRGAFPIPTPSPPPIIFQSSGPSIRSRFSASAVRDREAGPTAKFKGSGTRAKILVGKEGVKRDRGEQSRVAVHSSVA